MGSLHLQKDGVAVPGMVGFVVDDMEVPGVLRRLARFCERTKRSAPAAVML